jgi:hypothetical protein
MPSEKKPRAIAFLKQAVAYSKSQRLGLKHIRTKAYSPKTKGKARALHSDQPA